MVEQIITLATDCELIKFGKYTKLYCPGCGQELNKGNVNATYNFDHHAMDCPYCKTRWEIYEIGAVNK